MDWKFFRRFWQRFRVTRQKWILSARRTGRRIRDNLSVLPLRRFAVLFMIGLIFLSVLVWGFTRRVSVNKPVVPLYLDREEFFTEDIPAGEESARARMRTNDSPGEILTAPTHDTADFSQLQEEIAELRHRVQELAGKEASTAGEETAVPVFGRPVQGRLLRSTGWHRYGNEWRYHTGVDLSLPPGRNVMATAAGRVREIRTDPLLGWVVVIDHNAGWSSLYGHLNEVIVTPGFQVQKGTVLGKSSSSTCGPEPGIHFSLYHHGNPVDPLSVIPSLSD